MSFNWGVDGDCVNTGKCCKSRFPKSFPLGGSGGQPFGRWEEKEDAVFGRWVIGMPQKNRENPAPEAVKGGGSGGGLYKW